MSKCTSKMCELKTYRDSDKCILHCNKNDDQNNILIFEDFYNELINYIFDSLGGFIASFIESNIECNIETLRKYLFQEEINLESVEAKFLSEQTVYFKYINFPEIYADTYFDYKRILDRLGEIYFNFCEFNCYGLVLENVKVFFDECTFHNSWFLYNHKLAENIRNVLYQACTFNEQVYKITDDDGSSVVENSIFSDCIFNKDIYLKKIDLKTALFKNTEYKTLPAKKIEIIDCTFTEKTILNNYEIAEFICIGSEFNEKFEFKNNKVQSFFIDDSNFNKLVDCYKTEFEKCKIYKSIFGDFVGFEDCIFGKIDNKRSNTAEFIYATFLSFINFRNAKFLNGLDLKKINVKGVPNFYNVFIEPTNTDRETFRRVKDAFDKVGNFVDANDFYVYEMKKLKEELKSTNQYAKKFLLFLYEFTSNFGQSFTRPLIGLLISAIVYWLIVLGFENNILYSFFPKINFALESIAYFLNGIAKAILPFNKVLKQGMESVSLFFYIMFTSFIWLVILAIKRSTRR